MLAPLQRRLRAFAAAATLIWIALSITHPFTLIAEALVALGPACLVPLGAALAARADSDGRAHLPDRIAAALLPAGAAGAIASLVLPRGPLAGALASLWILAALALAAAGAARTLRRGLLPLADLAVDAGHLYLPVGAIWLSASRAGIPLLGFHEPVVLYTAAHFHFAGFGAPVIAGLLGREIAPSRAYAVITAVVLCGIPLVAAGITLTHALELPAAVLLSAGMLGLATLLVRAGARRVAAREMSGVLLVLAGATLVLSMGLAVVFAATGSATRGASEPLIAYTTMAAIHGSANAIGFAVGAMVGFTWRGPEAARAGR